MRGIQESLSFFFFNDTATTEIYTLSLHDALPISSRWQRTISRKRLRIRLRTTALPRAFLMLKPNRLCGSAQSYPRSEEHTSELQSHLNLASRLLLEKKKKPDRP